MKTSIARLSALAVIPLVAACGGSTTTVLNPGANGLPYAVSGLKADVTTMTRDYKNIAFKADTSSATITRNGATVTPVTAGTANLATTITIIDSATIDVQFGSGATTRFTRQLGGGSSGSITGDEWSNSSGTIKGIFALAGGAGSVTNVNSIFFGYLAEASTSGSVTNYADTFIMSGFETNPSGINSLPTATYTGPAQLVLRRANSADVDTPEYLIDNSNGTSLTANFGSNALTGTLSGTTSAALGAEPITLTVNATISGNGFSGGFTESGAASITLTGGSQSLEGNFYGVDALEIGGTLSTGIQSNGGTIPEDTLASGFFIGKRP